MDNSTLKNKFLSAKRRLFDKAFGEKLNPEQCRAVFTTEGPVLVLAGAGSGKTTVLVNRVAFIIKYGNAYFSDCVPEEVDENTVSALEYAATLPVSAIEEILPQFIHEPCPPWSVLAFTFTNKAAGEIKDRLLSRFGDEELANAVWAGTFHSICLRILRKHADKLGYREGFSIYDADDAKRLISDCMKELEVDEKATTPKAIAGVISRAKDELITADDFDEGGDVINRTAKRVYKLYTKKLLENNAVDFDDIIMQTVFLLEGYPEVREYYERKFRYVLVDEYQDTNHAQFVLTRLLSGGYRNIMVVGDDDQSIYRFRGATIENILSFDKNYPDATVIKLEQNYRSTATILAAANAVIGNNTERHEKKLWCDKGEGEKIVVKEAYDQNAEGKYIVDTIIGGMYKEKRRYSDYAVLYRVRQLGRSLETAFSKSGIPYRVIGDTNFYERKEIKDMLAYLSVVSSDADNLRLKRIINEPKRKIGDATVMALEELAASLGIPIFTLMSRADEYPVLSKTKDKLLSFVSLINGIRARELRPSLLISAIYQESGYADMLAAEGFEGRGKIENIEELVNAAAEYEKRMETLDGEPTLAGFLEEIALITSVDKYDENADAVVLMTVHAAKGLEFPVVFIAGMEDGIFPSESDRLDAAEMNEERRLAYVAITRAKERLYITHTHERMMYGRTMPARLSQFVREEIPRELIEIDKPKAPPPRAGFGYGSKQGFGEYRRPSFGEYKRPEGVPKSSELYRPVSTGSTRQSGTSGAAKFGIEKLSPGTAVRHAVFGRGTVLSAREMGGDILYEVKFDNGMTKKLMATFAKLEKI